MQFSRHMATQLSKNALTRISFINSSNYCKTAGGGSGASHEKEMNKSNIHVIFEPEDSRAKNVVTSVVNATKGCPPQESLSQTVQINKCKTNKSSNEDISPIQQTQPAPKGKEKCPTKTTKIDPQVPVEDICGNKYIRKDIFTTVINQQCKQEIKPLEKIKVAPPPKIVSVQKPGLGVFRRLERGVTKLITMTLLSFISYCILFGSKTSADNDKCIEKKPSENQHE